MQVIALCAVAIILPLFLAMVINQVSEGNRLFRYVDFFMFFNIILMGLILVGVRKLFHEQALAESLGWTYSPMFVQYTIMVIAASLPAIPAFFLGRQFKAAVCMSYGLYLLLIGLYHWTMLVTGLIQQKGYMSVLIGYDLITALILLAFSVALLVQKH